MASVITAPLPVKTQGFSLIAALTGALEIFGAARACAAATEAGRQPKAADLETLGIDVTEFRRIQLTCSH